LYASRHEVHDHKDACGACHVRPLDRAGEEIRSNRHKLEEMTT
jgi:hypothetical protein